MKFARNQSFMGTARNFKINQKAHFQIVKPLLLTEQT